MKGKRDFITSGAVYTILGFLPTASRFFLLPLYLHYLSPADFGLISLNTLVASVLSPFITLGLETAMSRFYFDFVKHPKILNAFFSTLILSILGFSAILSIVFIIVGPQLLLLSFKTHRFTFLPFGITALIAAIPSGLNSLYLGYLRCKKDLSNYVILNLSLFLLCTIGEIIAVIFMKMHVEQLVWVKPLISLPIIIIATLIVFWKTGVHFDMRLLRIAMSYSTPLLPHLIFGLVFIYTDRIMIENNLDLTYLAIYGLTIGISNIIDIFEQALRNATLPNIYKLLKENIYTNVEAVSRIHTINGLILMVIVCGIAFMTPVAAFYLLKDVYRPMLYLVPFALIVSIVRFYYIVYGEPLFFFKKVKYISASTFLQGSSAILFNFLLIPKFGLMGAIVANILSKCVQVVFVYYASMSIKVFRYKVGFILTSMSTMIVLLIVITFITRQILDNKMLIYALAFLPLVFTFFVLSYFVKKNNISLKQLW